MTLSADSLISDVSICLCVIMKLSKYYSEKLLGMIHWSIIARDSSCSYVVKLKPGNLMKCMSRKQSLQICYSNGHVLCMLPSNGPSSTHSLDPIRASHPKSNIRLNLEPASATAVYMWQTHLLRNSGGCVERGRLVTIFLLVPVKCHSSRKWQMLLPAQQAFEPTVEWPNWDCDVGPDGHLAVILPWCRQEKECTCAKEESQKGAGLSPVLITQ